jgi:hypothetical protein
MDEYSDEEEIELFELEMKQGKYENELIVTANQYDQANLKKEIGRQLRILVKEWNLNKSKMKQDSRFCDTDQDLTEEYSNDYNLFDEEGPILEETEPFEM